MQLTGTGDMLLGQHVYVEPDFGQTEVKDGIWIDESLVSYTHLDVYKRQKGILPDPVKFESKKVTDEKEVAKVADVVKDKIVLTIPTTSVTLVSFRCV